MGRRVTDLPMLSRSKSGNDDVEIDFVGRAVRDNDDRRSIRRENYILRHVDRISPLGREYLKPEKCSLTSKPAIRTGCGANWLACDFGTPTNPIPDLHVRRSHFVLRRVLPKGVRDQLAKVQCRLFARLTHAEGH